MGDWSNLPEEIVTKIVEHVEFYEDFETLRWICRPWRSAAKAAKFRACVNNVKEPALMGQEHTHTHTLPWLMLLHSSSSNTTRFSAYLYSFSKHMVREINLPKSFNNKYDKITLLSSYGWLLVVSGRRNPSLFYPFTGAIIELPTVKVSCDQYTGLKSYYWHQANEYKLILSANPATTSDYIVFLSLSNYRSTPYSVLVFWRNGDEGWIQVLYPHPSPTPGRPFSRNSFEAYLASSCQDIAYYQGEFYGVNCYNMIVKFDTAAQGGSPYFREVTNAFALLDRDGEKWSFYLVVFGCQLLLVRQVIWYDRINIRYETKRFDVFELNVKNGNVKEVSSLGNRAIFLGMNSSFSVEINSLAHGFKPNRIYLSADGEKWGLWKGPGHDGKDHCVYNLVTKKVERPLYNGHSSHLGALLMWVESPVY